MRPRPLALILIMALTLSVSGCQVLCPGCGAPREHHTSSSLVDYLYPRGELPPPENSIPELHVPLRVGLSFIPSASGEGPDAALKEQLLERVKAHFSDRKFVSEIVVIPDYYLSSNRGYSGLQSLQRLYSLDVIALVSYDQVMHAQENNWSIGYLTIVGAYVFKGDRYDFSTLVDLAVVDPGTRSLVLRAGGVDTRHANSTMIDAPRDAREASAAAFTAAAEQLITHLDRSLNDFEAQVRAGHAAVHVVHTDGSKGGAGAFSWGWLLGLLPLLAWRGRRRGVEVSEPDDPAARDPSARSEMRRPRTVRTAPAMPMRVPRLSGQR